MRTCYSTRTKEAIVAFLPMVQRHHALSLLSADYSPPGTLLVRISMKTVGSVATELWPMQVIETTGSDSNWSLAISGCVEGFVIALIVCRECGFALCEERRLRTIAPVNRCRPCWLEADSASLHDRSLRQRLQLRSSCLSS